MNHRVAIVLPVYKNDKVDYFNMSVESILRQTYPFIHLYLGVDGPIGDDLRAALNSLESRPRVTVVWFEENRGLACVLNDLIDMCFAAGFRYIARMDADDLSLDDRIEKQIHFMLNHPEIDVVGGAITEIDEEGKDRNKVIVYPESPAECRKFFSRRNPHAHPAVLFRKSFFDKMGGRKYRPEYRQNQDTMLWLDGFAHNTNNANIPDVVLKFRMTESLFKKRRNGWKFAKKQFKDRLLINRTLNYSLSADVFGIAMFVLQLLPTWMRKVAYKIFR